MNLYRIDIIEPDGSRAPLEDFLGVRLIRSRAAANEAARMAVAAYRRPARITRIQGPGHVKHMGTFTIGGRFMRPSN